MTGTIVVGVDASVGSEAALHWALREARIRGPQTIVKAVHVWAYPYMADVAYLARASLDRGDLENDAKAVLTEALRRVAAPDGDVRIEEFVAEGSAAQVLLELAKDADLLVVGSRGHGGFTGLLLGSVSQQCAHHSPCPVVIVPPTA